MQRLPAADRSAARSASRSISEAVGLLFGPVGPVWFEARELLAAGVPRGLPRALGAMLVLPVVPWVGVRYLGARPVLIAALTATLCALLAYRL